MKLGLNSTLDNLTIDIEQQIYCQRVWQPSTFRNLWLLIHRFPIESFVDYSSVVIIPWRARSLVSSYFQKSGRENSSTSLPRGNRSSAPLRLPFRSIYCCRKLILGGIMWKMSERGGCKRIICRKYISLYDRRSCSVYTIVSPFQLYFLGFRRCSFVKYHYVFRGGKNRFVYFSAFPPFRWHRWESVCFMEVHTEASKK